MSRPWIRACARAFSASVARSTLAAGVGLVILSACGGGGGDSSPTTTTPPPVNNTVSMSVSPASVVAAATTAQTAPTASIFVTLTASQANQQVYLLAKPTTNGIASVSGAGSASPVTVTVQFKAPSSVGAGVYNDTVQIMGCYDQACAQQIVNSPQTVQVQYTVTDTTVQLTSLSPSSAVASGPAFTLTVTGTNFTPGAMVLWNGNPRGTSYLSSTQLSTTIQGSDISAPGTVAVTVSDPTNGASNPLNFTIQPAKLTLSAISPTSVAVGGPPFMLTLLGSGFTATSTVQWNGTQRPSTLISTNELVAQISAADVAALGAASIAVQDPNSSVGTTPAQTLSVVAASKDAVAFQINPAHSGTVSFSSVSLPASAQWSVDVGGTPSYALIAAGLVIFTVTVAGSSEIVALDQATGATVWGPKIVAGQANAAYDAGQVFVISSPFANAATMIAFDVQTGAQKWSTLLAGQYAFSAAPTAADGLVFTGGAGSGGTLYALDETNGNIVWTQLVQNGDNSTPAVTADGVYVTYPCQGYDFRPATGELIYNINTGCEGGGGATPVVADQQFYAPLNVSGASGNIYNAETGASEGTYVADSPPAITATTGYFLQSGTLRGVELDNDTVKWSFAGDGKLAGSPIVVNQYVFIGSASGNVYGLNGTTGSVAWQMTLPAPIVTSTGALPFSGLAAGDGLLVVPAGTKVTAYLLSANP